MSGNVGDKFVKTEILSSGFDTFIDLNNNGFMDKEESKDSFVLGSIIEIANEKGTEPKINGGKILVFSGTSWITDKYFPTYLNRNFAVNSINWMNKNQIIDTIVSKKEDVLVITLTPNQKIFIWVVGLFLYPAIIILGLSSYTVYKRKKS
jgi:hypothetical protein